MTQPKALTQALADWPSVSVIIPVLNDEAGLTRCLAALAQQTYPRSRFESIVIDNGSDQIEGLQRLAAVHQATLIQELAPGAYAARNAGIALATGEIIAFTDADCIPAPDWLERGVEQLEQHPDCGLVVGRVDVFPQDRERPNLVEVYQMVTAFRQDHFLQQFRGGATANVFTRRSVMETVGGFNPELKSFGDFEWGQRIYGAKYSQIYAPDVRVEHPTRPTWAALRKQTLRDAGGFYDYFVGRQGRGAQRHITLVKMVFLDLIPPVNFAVSTFRDKRLKTLRQRLGVAWVFCCIRYLNAFEKIRLWLGGTSIQG
ncbi:MAG: glycosyltransferase [Nodosilinea sp.]